MEHRPCEDFSNSVLDNIFEFGHKTLNYKKVTAKHTKFIGVPINENQTKSRDVGTEHIQSRLCDDNTSGFDLKKVKKEPITDTSEYQLMKIKEEKQDEDYEKAYGVPYIKVASKPARSGKLVSSADSRRSLNGNAGSSESIRSMDTCDQFPFNQSVHKHKQVMVSHTQSKQTKVNKNNQQSREPLLNQENNTSNSCKPCQRKRHPPSDVDVDKILPKSKRRKTSEENMSCSQFQTTQINHNNGAKTKRKNRGSNKRKRRKEFRQWRKEMMAREIAFKKSLNNTPSNMFRCIPYPPNYDPSYTKIELQQCEICRRAWFSFKELLVHHIERCSRSQNIIAKSTKVIGHSTAETNNTEYGNYPWFFEGVQSKTIDDTNKTMARTKCNDSRSHDDSIGLVLKKLRQEEHVTRTDLNTCGFTSVNIKKEKEAEEYGIYNHAIKPVVTDVVDSFVDVKRVKQERGCSSQSSIAARNVSNRATRNANISEKHVIEKVDINNNENKDVDGHNKVMSKREATMKLSSNDCSQNSEMEKNQWNENRALRHERMCTRNVKVDNSKLIKVKQEVKQGRVSEMSKPSLKLTGDTRKDSKVSLDKVDLGLKLQSNSSCGKSTITMCTICKRAWFKSELDLQHHVERCFERRGVEMFTQKDLFETSYNDNILCDE